MEEITIHTDENAWQPAIGSEFNNLIDQLSLSHSEKRQLEQETTRILSKCGNPNEQRHSETGLVIGYVQSGKTLSFTSLAALARDNGYQMVIVIAGTSNPLLDQSTKRLEKDLGLERNERKWILYKNPNHEQGDRIQSVLSRWRDPNLRMNRKSTILITVGKNSSRLGNLAQLLLHLDLEGVPTLIIDDEGDQASLNTRARSNSRNFEIEESATYSRISELKNVIPHHTFLQYTATPQAPLFINIMDRLSPNFITLLTPGENYTGGREFFLQNRHLVRRIPAVDIDDHSTLPQSLVDALKMFYIGVALGEYLEEADGKNRSMMVHPSRLTADQNTYVTWIRNVRDRWLRTFEENENDPDRIDLLEEFRNAYLDIQETVGQIPEFDSLITELKLAIEHTAIMEVNARTSRTPEVPWRDHYSFILVGGQAMDRGFTVEGLTVTYMPRPAGVGNADTIQQRARFFGYKRSYLGYCRIFLEEPMIDRYRAYIEHEEDVRERLKPYDIENTSLNDWQRVAVLDSMLRLCRVNVISETLIRSRFGNNWIRRVAPHDSNEIMTSNSEFIESFIRNHSSEFLPDAGSEQRTNEQRHMNMSIPLENIYNELLTNLRFTRNRDSLSYTTLLTVLRSAIDNSESMTCELYLMSAFPNAENWNARTRALEGEVIRELFQGKNPRTGPVIYPGDSEIKDRESVTIQIHKLNLSREVNGQNRIVHNDIHTLAIWVPRSLNVDIISISNS